MRWRYLYDKHDLDFQKREASLSLIGAFWSAFQKDRTLWEGIRHGKPDTAGCASWMEEHLHSINPNLMWEVAVLPDKGLLLVISPEDRVELRSLVSSIIDRAPLLDGWKFGAYRLSEEPSLIETAYEGRTGERFLKNLAFKLEKTENNQINLIVHSSDFKTANAPNDMARSLSLATITLGEEKMEKWIGMVLSSGQPGRLSKLFNIFGRKDFDEVVPPQGLLKEVEFVIKEIISTLPECVLAEKFAPDNCEWSVLSVRLPEKPTSENVPERLTFNTFRPAIFTAISRSTWFFSSERFSRCGETFCYIKCKQNSSDEFFRDKLHDAIDKTLRQSKMGCVIGGGVGPAHIFIDMAITNIDECIESLRDECKRLDAPPETWLLFYDTHWRSEWVGLHPKSISPFPESACID